MQEQPRLLPFSSAAAAPSDTTALGAASRVGALTQNYPGAKSALLAETSLQGPLAEKGAGALRVMPSSRGTRQTPRWPGLMQPLIPSLPDKRLCLPGPGWPLCPHRVLSFAFQNLAGLSPGLTKASGSVPAAAPERAMAPGSTRGSWILYGELVSSLPLRPRAPGVAPCPEQRAAALQQPRAGNPRGAAGSPESAPLQPVRALELPGAEAPVPGTGSAHQRQPGPSADLSDGICSATATRLSLPALSTGSAQNSVL